MEMAIAASCAGDGFSSEAVAAATRGRISTRRGWQGIGG